MGKRIFGIFILLLSLATVSLVLYIQSESFAKLAKRKIQKEVSSELGVQLDFDRLRIGVLPPSLSLVNVELRVTDRTNKLGLSPDAVFRAGRLGFSFRMIQAFSRGIYVNKLFLSDGEIRLNLPKSGGGGQSKDKLSDLVHRPIKVELSRNFFATIRQIEVRSTAVTLGWLENGRKSRVDIGQVQYLALTPSIEGTNLVANLEDSAIDTDSVKETLKTLRVNADIQKTRTIVSSFDAQRRDAALHASGKFVGSIDNPGDLRPDVDVILRSPFKELADFEKSLAPLDGEIIADVKMVGRIQNPAFQGKVKLSGFRYSLWNLDSVELQGSYVTGSVVLDSLLAKKGGGSISLRSQVEIPLPLKPQAVALRLQFTNANFEDFAGDLRKDVNNLKMNMNGAVSLRLDFVKGGGDVKLSAFSLLPELDIHNLELNNQTYGRSKEYKRIFGLAPFKLSGGVSWKSGEVKIQDAKLVFASGSIDAKGTVSLKGYDIAGTSEFIDLGKEVGDIGGNPLIGAGPAKFHVRGPNTAVFIDFDLKQKNAKFVNFDFGDIDGRITYDDQRSYIYISGLKGAKNSSRYLVDGKVNVGEGDDLSLSATFEDSDPNDVFAIFAKQLEKISWIPHGMGGRISGQARVGGGYDKGLDSLEIDSVLHGKNLIYKGELVHAVEVKAGVKDGIIFAKDLNARKYDTVFTGWIEYYPNEEMEYELVAEKGKLRSLDLFAAAGVPIDGIVQFRSEGKGKWETLKSKTTVALRSAFVRTMPLPPADFIYETFADHSEFEAHFGGEAELRMSMAQGASGESRAELTFAEANLSPVLCLLNRRICTDPAAKLELDAAGQFVWKGGEWRSMNGELAVESIEVAKSGYRLASDSAFKVTSRSGKLDSGRVAFTGEDSRLTARLSGTVDGSALEHDFGGELSMKALEFISPLIEEARGKIGVDLALAGKVSDARFQGALSFQEGFLRLSGLEAPVDTFNGRIRFSGNRANVESLTGQIGGGPAQISGGFDIFLNRPPSFGLDIFLTGNRLKFFPVNFAEFSEARLSFTGDGPPYLFGGTARVKRVMMRNNFDVGKQKALQNARYLPDKISGSKALYEIRIRAIAENGVVVQNDLLDAEFRGELTLLNNFEFPQVVARAELVRGKLLFRNTAFTLDHAFIRAPTPEVFNPQFSIGGVANVDNYRISIFASGTIDKPKISLSSAPSLPQEDIISLLAFGYRGEDARKVNPADTSALTYSEVGSILLEQLRLSQNLQSKGLKVSVAPSISDNEANIIRPNSAPGAVSPKVYLQTQILKNLDATFGSTVGSTQGQEVDASLEYRLGRKASVNAVYEQEPGLDATEKKNSYGADLKFRWGFK